MTLVEHEQAMRAAVDCWSGTASMHTQHGLMTIATRRARKICGMLEHDGPRRTVTFLRAWQLNRRLRRYREILAAAWSEATSYQPSMQRLRSSTPPSLGQCGVSSAWLIPRLSWHQRWRATYCVGHVILAGGRGETELHCWVEIGRTAGRLVIDLTFDQFGHQDGRKVVCAPHRALLDESIEYRSEARMRFRHLHEDDVWQRYRILRETTAEQQAFRRHWTAALSRR